MHQMNQPKSPDVTFRIPPKALLAMRLLQHNDESRFAICGVNFEIHPNGIVLLIASNGRYLGILKADAIVSTDIKELVSFTVDYPFVRYLPKPPGSDFEKVLVHYDGVKVHFHSKGKSVMHDVIKADFPKWRQIIPTTPFAPFDMSVNPEYLQTFMKVARVLGGKDYQHIVIKGHQRSATKTEHDTYSPYSIFMPNVPRTGQEFYGVLMPMREPACEVPKWLDLPEVKAPLSKVEEHLETVPKLSGDTSHVTPAVAQADAQSEASERCAAQHTTPIVAVAPGMPPLPHPIIPPSTKTTKYQARKERKNHVHKHHPRSRKNLDRLRRNRHRAAR